MTIVVDSDSDQRRAADRLLYKLVNVIQVDDLPTTHGQP